MRKILIFIILSLLPAPAMAAFNPFGEMFALSTAPVGQYKAKQPRNDDCKDCIKARRGVSIERLKPRLRGILKRLARHYGETVYITSGCRSHRHNRRIGGARRSMHLKCMAADIKIKGVTKRRIRKLLKSWPDVGGIGTYSHNRIVHIDIGKRRSWHYKRKKRRYVRKHRRSRYKRRS